MRPESRKGMKTAKVDLRVHVDETMIRDPAGIYLAEYRFIYGKDNDVVKRITTYNHYHHDLSIDFIIRESGILNKTIKSVDVKAISKHGDSVSNMWPIVKWKITDEKKTKS